MKKRKKIFDFHFIDNGLGLPHPPSISFKCPMCGGFHKTVGLDEYTPDHEFYDNVKFFCDNCLSEFITKKDRKIELLSRAFVFD